MSYPVFELQDVSCENRALLFGPQDAYLKLWEKSFQTNITIEDDTICVDHETELVRKRLSKTISSLYQLILEQKEFDLLDVRKITEHYMHKWEEVEDWYHKPIARSYDHRAVYPKTQGQLELLKSLREKDMTFVSGPAGTGKTFLAVVYAVSKLKNEEVNRLIITRPVVEAGENLGFLPGDLKEKVDPYLRPIYDALQFMLGPTTMERYIEKGIIEIAPLAYMRGRTLDDAIVILDEAQNTTKMQMKMFLTRMGFHSRMIITGDETQTDLPNPKSSGFQDAMHRLQGIEEIGFVHLTNEDVVRHPLVRKILENYENR